MCLLHSGGNLSPLLQLVLVVKDASFSSVINTALPDLPFAAKAVP